MPDLLSIGLDHGKGLYMRHSRHQGKYVRLPIRDLNSIKETASALTRFKRAERQRTGAKSIKRGQEVPIAVLVPSVTLRSRFDLPGLVRSQMPKLSTAILQQLNAQGL